MEQLGFTTLVDSFKSGKAPANLRGAIIFLSQVCRAYLSNKDSDTRQIAQKMLYAATKNYFTLYERENANENRTATQKKTLAQEKGTHDNPKFQRQTPHRRHMRRRGQAGAGSLRDVSRPETKR